jgi:circadian clock protein KaiC
MLGGGLTGGTTTLVAGSPGVGKTVLGLQFLLEGARVGERGLFLGFSESIPQLQAHARSFGMDLETPLAAGTLRLAVQPAEDLEADQVGALIREECATRDIRRLVIDSAAELEHAVATDRGYGFFAALVEFLRSQRVSSYITRDIPVIVGQELDFTGSPLSALAENLVLLRRVEYRGELAQVISVLKMRFSAFDNAIHLYTLTDGRGITVLGPVPRVAGFLTGLARGEGGDAEPPTGSAS